MLIEVLVSLLLLAGGMTGALHLVKAAQTALNDSRDRVHATVLVQSLVEEVQTPFYRLRLGDKLQDQTVLGGVTRHWEVHPAPLGLDGFTLRAAAGWMEAPGQPRQVEIILYRPSGVVP